MSTSVNQREYIEHVINLQVCVHRGMTEMNMLFNIRQSLNVPWQWNKAFKTAEVYYKN